jgi:phosphohistidine phosphatase
MRLLIVRHADAEPHTTPEADSRRALTPKGVRKMHRVTAALAALDLSLDRIETSPWRRARETAELMRPLLHGELVENPLLAKPPGARLVNGLSGHVVALVGHEPWLGELVGRLVCDPSGPLTPFPLRKGGVAWLEGEPRPGAMELVAFLPPRVLRRVET